MVMRIVMCNVRGSTPGTTTRWLLKPRHRQPIYNEDRIDPGDATVVVKFDMPMLKGQSLTSCLPKGHAACLAIC